MKRSVVLQNERRGKLTGWVVLGVLAAAGAGLAPRLTRFTASAQEARCDGLAEFDQMGFWQGEWKVTGHDLVEPERRVVSRDPVACRWVESWVGRARQKFQIEYRYDPALRSWKMIWAHRGRIHRWEGRARRGWFFFQQEEESSDSPVAVTRIGPLLEGKRVEKSTLVFRFSDPLPEATEALTYSRE